MALMSVMAGRKKAPVEAARQPAFSSREVEAKFDAYPSAIRAKLLRLRHLIFETAAATEGVSDLEETLKWGQPSYLTVRPKSGSTIRIDQVSLALPRYAVYFHCQTDLVATFRELYPDRFRYEGNRSIVFDAGDPIPRDALKHCIALALTYHLRKKGRGRRRP